METNNYDSAIINEIRDLAKLISHDLKQPLVSAIGLSQLLKLKYRRKLDDDGISMLALTETEMKRELGQIEGLVTYLRMVFREREIETVEVNQMIDEVKMAIRDEFRKHRLIIENNLPNKLKVKMDKEDLLFILQSIIQNAMDFKAEDRKPVLTISAVKSDNKYTLVFQDNGRGFKNAYEPQIYSLFSSIEASYEDRGIGVSMAVVNKIVGIYNCTVKGEGEVGKGAVFYVEVPA